MLFSFFVVSLTGCEYKFEKRSTRSTNIELLNTNLLEDFTALCKELMDNQSIQEYMKTEQFKNDVGNQSLFKKSSDYWIRNRYDIDKEAEEAVEK